ncbi:MAG: DUF5667 domain-containing protein [Anaerolineae bacterium]
MSQKFEALLAEALSRLEQGETVGACLARYPEHADRLAPLLRTAAFSLQALAYVEPPSEAALAAGRRRLLRQVARQWATPEPWWRRLPSLSLPRLAPARGLATLALVILLFVALGGGAAVAAVNSLPGDPLYPVKLATERARLALTLDPGARTALQAQFAQERREEAWTVVALGRRTQVRFQGTLEAFDARRWTVGGLTLLIEPDTMVEGQPSLGATVVVEALSPGDGTLRARHLTVRAPEGPGEALTATAHPTETRRPTRTPYPTHTRTPYPTETHEPQPTHSPMRPRATERPMPTMTAHPTEERGPMMTPQPGETHEPQPTHEPMMTPPPTEPPEPTQESPRETREPEPTHEPMMSPEPEETHGPMMTPGPHRTRDHH